MAAPILVVDDLSVSYPADNGRLQALQHIGFSIAPGQALGLVGESGSGKSTAAMAVLGLLDKAARVDTGSVRFRGEDLYAMDDESRRKIRGDKISIVFQDPFTSLNPSLRVGRQIVEPLVMHRGLSEDAARAEAARLLAEVGIPDPARMLRSYPHELSGGMKQRAMIAIALACEPELLILDEPTTALDVTVEAQILDLLDALRRSRSLAILFISHNLGVVSRTCDDICVLYAGQLIERGATREVLANPRHPYTKGLLASLPVIGGVRHRLEPIPGRLPDLTEPQSGCIFQPRCHFALPPCAQPQPPVQQAPGHEARCWRAQELAGTPWQVNDAAEVLRKVHLPPAASQPVLVQADDIRKTFHLGGWFDSLRLDLHGGGFPIKRVPQITRAIDGVSLRIAPGEIVGLVGESGCGKTTLGRCLIDLVTPTGGTVRIDGEDLLTASPAQRRELRQKAQIVFQNPDSSLNPRKTVRDIIGRPLELFGLAEGDAVERRVMELLDMVRLAPRYADRYPHQMSGGEKQRVGIARALATNPKFVVCDEAVSALDVSVQASVLNLLSDLRDQLGVAYLFISHDLSVISHIADRICVMYRGAIVEEGPTEQVLAPPHHPYTEALLAAVPVVGATSRRHVVPRAANDGAPAQVPGAGCRFSSRCQHRIGVICDTIAPPVRQGVDGHRVLCHIPLEDLRTRAREAVLNEDIAAQAV
jgi:peptide/nickel transport system ATP-binding protein